MPKRKFPNWLRGLMTYIEETESPRNFWMWSGLFTLTSALQRKVWLPYGLDNIYPNLYVLIVAPPAICRKGAPVGLAKKMLTELKFKVSVDSSSKRALTQELADVSNEQFHHNGKPLVHASMAVISKEMSSLLATDPKGMIEILTDLFDPHDVWEHKTSGQGYDVINNVCVGCLIATTPTWLSSNLPYEAIGGGFSSRFAIVSGNSSYKEVPIPPIPDIRIYEGLMHDLQLIGMITGEFAWEDEACDHFVTWYNSLKDQIKELKDDRLHSFMGRIHIVALKAAMALRVSYSSNLTITLSDITTAIGLLDQVLVNASDALGGAGLSKLGPVIDKINRQLRDVGKIYESELLKWHYRDLEGDAELNIVMNTISKMGLCQEGFDSNGLKYYKRKEIE